MHVLILTEKFIENSGNGLTIYGIENSGNSFLFE